ncbi:thioesterase II family protein [Streptomyces seoulensis]|uniref:thioesterase II family protein n=1 Tax=Streptomyces seoulensis TaxID=73044 RepID=UPI001FCAAAF1|nr:alpha/beta fold hydrolase [Streptomyces seoulensis]BDH07134.1 thioesterase [Streptomyces seoulensis]
MPYEPWLSPLRRPTSLPLARIVVIPHSGAGPNSLLPLVKHVPAPFEVVGVTLPGRERRFGEEPEISPEDLLGGIARELSAMPSLPTVLFGHSLGGSIAFALSVMDPCLCSALVISAQLPCGSQIERPREWGDDALMGVLRRGGGTPAQMLDDPAWRDHTLRLLRADLALGGQLALRNAHSGVAHPLTVIGGEQDLLVPVERLGAWSERVDAAVDARVLPGGHFYLLDDANVEAVADVVTAAARAIAAVPDA